MYFRLSYVNHSGKNFEAKDGLHIQRGGLIPYTSRLF